MYNAPSPNEVKPMLVKLNVESLDVQAQKVAVNPAECARPRGTDCGQISRGKGEVVEEGELKPSQLEFLRGWAFDEPVGKGETAIVYATECHHKAGFTFQR
jgi:hypothetical protein